MPSPSSGIGRHVIPILAGLVLTLATGQAIADAIFLTDGRVYRGRIVRETHDAVIIDAVLHGIRSEITVSRSQIQSIVRTEDDSIFEQHEQTRAERETEPRAAPDGRRFLEVPIVGEFGRDIYPKGVDAALDWAVRNDVTDIVFRIDSPGGEVWAAETIVDILSRYEDRLTYHALIERAISAAIWPTFASHTITMVPRSTIGGATIFRRFNTGAVEVDRKLNSVFAANLAAVAETRGHSGAVVRAMILDDAPLFAVREADESPWSLTSEHPGLDSAGQVRTLQAHGTILTLTASEATELGVAMALDAGTPDAVARVLEIDDWSDAGGYGGSAMHRFQRLCHDLRAQLGEVSREIWENIERFEEATTYDDAIEAATAARNGLARYVRLTRRASGLEMQAIVEQLEQRDVRRALREIDSAIDEMRRRRRGG